MISIMKKSIHLLLLAGIAFLAASCFQSGPSTARYRILADFEYAVSADNLSYFQDSLFSAEIIPLDNLSSLCSKVENGVTVGGWTLSIMRDSLAKDGTLSPFASCRKDCRLQRIQCLCGLLWESDPNRMAKYDIFSISSAIPSTPASFRNARSRTPAPYLKLLTTDCSRKGTS